MRLEEGSFNYLICLKKKRFWEKDPCTMLGINFYLVKVISFYLVTCRNITKESIQVFYLIWAFWHMHQNNSFLLFLVCGILELRCRFLLMRILTLCTHMGWRVACIDLRDTFTTPLSPLFIWGASLILYMKHFVLKIPFSLSLIVYS